MEEVGMISVDPSNMVAAWDAMDLTEAQEYVTVATDEFLAGLPDPSHLTAERRRGIIARYTAVLEGNFIYWMTGAYLSAKTDQARSIILDNLREEIADCHPGMMRRFAIAAQAVPTEADMAAVYEDLSNVRSFVGRLCGVQMLLMMAFFEGLIQRFMPYLADLAERQASHDMEYTDVHGVCDIAHTAGLLRALDAEAAGAPVDAATDPYDGVHLLKTLLETVVHGSGKYLSGTVQ
jgi:Iron-containing redox enzyme